MVSRIKVIQIIFFLALFLIVLRLGYWQIVKADDLSAMAESQRVSVQEIKPSRGTIYFSDRSILASTQPAFSLFAQPKVIFGLTDAQKEEGIKIDSFGRKDTFSQGVSNILFNLEQTKKQTPQATTEAELKAQDDLKKTEQADLKQSIFKKIDQDLYWVSLSKEVTIDTKKQLDALNLPGLGYDSTTMRFYPEGSSSAHLLGFVSSDVYGNDAGYFGLEGFYNGELKGKKGRLSQEKDALGFPILIGKFIDQEAKPGKDLVLNVDPVVQHVAEEKLKAGVIKYGAKGGSVIIMDPNTGGILAMASYPNYNPSFPEYFPKPDLRNPATLDGYEPGSTFKVLIAAAGINEGVITPETRCDVCAGPVNINEYSIRTWNNQYRPNLTMTDVIVHSDNTGMVFIAKKLGLDRLYSYIDRFGFGKPTEIDLQDESSPDLRPKDEWGEIDQATASFGQGISVTALQIVRAVAAIANGGKLMEPHVVSEIIDGDKTFKVNPRVINQVITPETAKQVTEMMVSAVDEGEAQYYKKVIGVAGYKIAGKTGTAQIPIKGHYDKDKTIASFVGFAPADKPRFVMLVKYNEPTSSIYGADTAAPTFFNIAKDLFTYYDIVPTEQ